MTAPFSLLRAAISQWRTNRRADKDAAAQVKHEDALRAATPPLFIMIGSMSHCSRKDAVAYVRGLAEKYTSSLETTWVHVEKDPYLNRYNFEVQEGGEGFSLLDKTLAHLASEGKALIRLAGNKCVVIEEAHEQLHSLIVPDADEVKETIEFGGAAYSPHAQKITTLTPVAAFSLMGSKRMTRLFVESKGFMYAGVALLTLSITAVSAVFVANILLHSSFLDPTLLIRSQINASAEKMQDSPLLNLGRAKAEATRANGYIQKLYKEDGRWRWEIGQ